MTEHLAVRDPAERVAAPAAGADAYEPLRRSLGSLLAAERRLRGREQQRRDGGLSHSHLHALFLLTHQPEATAGTLAREAELNPASVTAMIDQLEGRGLVQRRRDPHDRRQCWISLTDAGRREVEEKEQYWRAVMGEMLADVTAEEVVAATKVVDRITTVIERFSEP